MASGASAGLPAGFLSSISGDDVSFRPPPRRHCLVEPLIDGDETREALERAVAGARDTLYLAFWEFDPRIETLMHWTPDPSLSSHLGASAARRPWRDLLADAVARGVDVRVLMSDFDPWLALDRHWIAWTHYQNLEGYLSPLIPSVASMDEKRFQVICSLHEATLRPGGLELLAGGAAAGATLEHKFASLRIDATLATLDNWVSMGAAPEDLLERVPGLWGKVELDATGKFAATVAPPLPLHLAVHHVKLCVVDGRMAFVGGFNVNPRLVLSTRRHETKILPPGADSDPDPVHLDSTHDTFCRVAGPVVADFERFFVGLWNRELPRFRKFVDDANDVAPGLGIITTPLTSIPSPPGPGRAMPGSSVAQLIRTVTGDIPPPAPGAVAVPLPTPIRLDTLDSLRDAIGAARDFIYLENQYFRLSDIATWIVDAAAKRPKLQVIIVLPVRPEEGTDPVTQHGNALQFEALQRVDAALKHRFGLFTLLSPTPDRHPDYLGARSVYVHSKAWIVDDRFALIGTANANGRGLFVDTEVGLAWSDPFSVRAFRVQLWSHILGKDIDYTKLKPDAFAGAWHVRAGLNAALDPPDRKGLAAPLPLSALPQGARLDALPLSLLGFGDLAPMMAIYASSLSSDAEGLPAASPAGGGAGAAQA